MDKIFYNNIEKNSKIKKYEEELKNIIENIYPNFGEMINWNHIKKIIEKNTKNKIQIEVLKEINDKILL